MSNSDFVKIFYNTIVGEYRDWKRDVKKTSWDRTNNSLSKLSWTATNDKTQDVVFGIQGPSKRHFMDNDCKSPLRQDYVRFSLKNSAGQTIKDSFTGSNNLRTGGNGQSWISVDNLPAGTYKIEANGAAKPSSSGDMPFAVLTFGETTKVTLA